MTGELIQRRPRPEVNYATKATLAQGAREEKIVLFNLCGRGHFDLAAHEQQYLAGNLVNFRRSEEEIERAVARIPPG